MESIVLISVMLSAILKKFVSQDGRQDGDDRHAGLDAGGATLQPLLEAVLDTGSADFHLLAELILNLIHPASGFFATVKHVFAYELASTRLYVMTDTFLHTGNAICIHIGYRDKQHSNDQQPE